MISFNARSPYCRGYIAVRVYDHVDDMRAASLAYSRAPIEEDAVGVFNPAPRAYQTSDEDVEITHLPFGGVMRLAQPHLAPVVVVHECVHAAARLVAFRYPGPRFVDDPDQDIVYEEDLAHVTGELFRSICNQLYEEKLWQ